jgi:glutathione S-transferase
MELMESIIAELEIALNKYEFVLCEHYTIVDVIATCFLARIEMIKKIQNVPEKDHFSPNVAKYFNAMKKRPSYSDAKIIDTF